MSTSLPSSTQLQRDAINAYRRSYNERHQMLPDGRMQIKLYSRLQPIHQQNGPINIAFVERNGSVSYGRQAVA